MKEKSLKDALESAESEVDSLQSDLKALRKKIAEKNDLLVGACEKRNKLQEQLFDLRRKKGL